jgi:CheY-like chemotaxis protein
MSLKFLVVDDEEGARAGLSLLLEKAYPDAAIFQAKDGAEGLSLAMKERPDLVVCDVQMPAVDGIELIDRLRKQKVKTRVILLTAYAEKIVYQVAKLGVSCVLNKPLDAPQLYAAVKRALIYDSPLSLYGNDSDVVQEVVRENSELRDEIGVPVEGSHRITGTCA